MIWALSNTQKPHELLKVNHWFSMSQYFLLRISECLNPIFYNFGSSVMRKCTFALLERIFCNCFRRAPVTRKSLGKLEGSTYSNGDHTLNGGETKPTSTCTLQKGDLSPVTTTTVSQNCSHFNCDGVETCTKENFDTFNSKPEKSPSS